MTGRMSRDRGATTERMIVAWLRDHGHPDARRRLAGNGQAGDIDGVPGLVIESKGVRRSAWTSWCAQAHTEANGTPWCVVRRAERVRDVAVWPCVASPTALGGATRVHVDRPLTIPAALTRAQRWQAWVEFEHPGLGRLCAGSFGWLILDDAGVQA